MSLPEEDEKEPWCSECFTFIEAEDGLLKRHRNQSLERCDGSGQVAQLRKRQKARRTSVPPRDSRD